MKLLVKSTILIIGLIVTLMILQASAFAKNGPHIGPVFPENTDACALCHRLHTASGSYLLSEGTTIFSLCTSCHDGSGANTNILQGRFEGTINTYGTQNDGAAGKGLNGGGYFFAFEYSGRNNRATGFGPVTSRHNITGLDNDPYFIAWGGGSVGPGFQMTLDCTNCHDPHGTENVDGSERYRILRNVVNDKELGDISAHEETGYNYTAIRYREGIADFCSACHTQYILKVSKYDAGDGKDFSRRVRHTVPQYLANGNARTGNRMTIAQNLNSHIQLPVQQTAYSDTISGSDQLTCLTCHQVHGSNVENTDNAKVSPANSTTLLRIKNRGVCQDCHQR